MFDAGIPRDRIIANRADNNRNPRTIYDDSFGIRLPYADNSIAFIICNLGMLDICKWSDVSEKKAMMREMGRVLKAGGKMVVAESQRADSKMTSMFSPMTSYKRILVEELDWPDANSNADTSTNSRSHGNGNADGEGGAKTAWAWGLINYLEATKPRTETQSV
jgi:hypothetical protein